MKGRPDPGTPYRSPSSGLAVRAGVFNPVEDLGGMDGQSELFVEGLRAGVAGIGGPLNTAASVLAGRLEEGAHEKLADAPAAVRVRDVQLFQVERPGKANGWP